MSLQEEEKEKLVRVAAAFGIRQLWLFGSAMAHDEYNDIDLGVEGLKKGSYYEFLSLLDIATNKQIDLIDMDGKNPMRHIIRDRGQVIYERRGRKVPQGTQTTHKKHARIT
jgi:predicted nucleotidyltransferase